MTIALAKPGIGKIKPHMVDGDVRDAAPVTALLNSNESVYGPGPQAIEAARVAASGMERYYENPDDTLAPCIADHFGLRADRITTGQGSDDLLARLARAYLGPGTNLIRSANGYLKVPNYAFANDAEVISVADDNFKPSVERMIAAVTDQTRIVYLANPENPAGTYLSGAEVRRLHASLPPNVLLVMDCAYEEYVDAADYEPAARLVEEAGNVVMCRTFSKIFGLAGARVGWLYGPQDVVDSMRRIALTFPVASISIAAALAALKDRAHAEMVFEANLKGRHALSDQLTGLGLDVIPSQTNFLLVKFRDPDRPAASVDRFLRARGIAIRRFAAPAFKDFIRITIGRPGEMQAVAEGVSDFLKAGE